MRRTLFAGAGLTAALLASFGFAGGTAKVDYPDGYRSWQHVKSMVILPGHALADPFAGIHHVYANDKALAGLASGRFEDGAVLVFDLLAAEDAGSAFAEGPRKFIGIMQRDAEAFASTGGWGYEAFAGDSRDQRLVDDGGQSCHACHAEVQASGYVFSRPRD